MTTSTVALRWRLARQPHIWVYPVAGAAAVAVVAITWPRAALGRTTAITIK